MVSNYKAHEVEAELRRIAHNGADGDGMVHAAARTLFRLPESDRIVVVEATTRLANEVPKLGPVTAFEVVAATARRVAKSEAVER